MKRQSLVAVAIALALALFQLPGRWGAAIAQDQTASGQRVDTALVVSVDVSGSVDSRRFRLQMDGVAEALEDANVQRALLNGPSGAILFALVAFADRPLLALPWTRIASLDDARRVAATVRNLNRPAGDFTCITRMMRFVIDKVVTQIPLPASRVVIDISGDGAENCNPGESTDSVRDELAGYGVTINGLPIKDGQEALTIEDWYRAHVMGGPGSFVLPADGYRDFGRAMRQKFVVEISGGAPVPRRSAEATVTQRAAPAR